MPCPFKHARALGPAHNKPLLPRPACLPAPAPQDALRGGLFHLNAAAQGGCVLALLVLARAHCGIDATAPQFAQVFKVRVRGSVGGKALFPTTTWCRVRC